MAEVFYDMSHLTTDELRELFTSYRELGWIDYEYEVQDENSSSIQPLSDAEIIVSDRLTASLIFLRSCYLCRQNEDYGILDIRLFQAPLR